ncbi:hypothetical protein CEXT_367841 [Caerostris extrusa]|uniref:Uncharacterized protein n=1 Tax=Caerostris extrusa TaxID=172846 RepID=A0AAV4N938_CAEEX|nr:hypothetical protein CEXT_367841 [Caerostris extrusa]
MKSLSDQFESHNITPIKVCICEVSILSFILQRCYKGVALYEQLTAWPYILLGLVLRAFWHKRHPAYLFKASLFPVLATNLPKSRKSTCHEFFLYLQVPSHSGFTPFILPSEKCVSNSRWAFRVHLHLLFDASFSIG